MQEVRIYIETSTIAPRATKADGMYVMEAYEDGRQMLYKGEPVIVYEVMHFEHCNTNIITLTLLIAALERMQKGCTVHIHTRTEHVFWTLKNDWLGGWKKPAGSLREVLQSRMQKCGKKSSIYSIKMIVGLYPRTRTSGRLGCRRR